MTCKPWRLRLEGLVAAVLFWAATACAAAVPLGFDAARHLLNRTGFAAGIDEVNAVAQLTREQAVGRLLSGAGKSAITPPPDWVEDRIVPPRELRAMSDEQRKTERDLLLRRGLELREWWLQEMLATASPLTEKMTLFWHNHFVSGQQKVRYPQLMYRQNALLRRHALGNFGDLLHAVAKDPAMVIYLDSASNRKAQPNENFAREVMELFTLGEGQYTERDVKEAARAFTGWSIDPARGEFLFRRLQHDDGVKTVLGRSGNFDGDAVLDILLAQPQTAEFIVGKLWREFVSPVPDPQAVKRVAGVFRDSRYDIRPTLHALLTSEAFYAQQNRAALIKSPVELVVGTLRQFGFTTGALTPFVFTTARLGQNIFSPPNVKGWPGGEAWINSTTLLARKQFIERLFRADEMQPAVAGESGMGGRLKGAGRLGSDGRQRLMQGMADLHLDGDKWLSKFMNFENDSVRRLLLASAPVNPQQPGIQGMALIRHLTRDPAYQLK